MFRAQMFTVSGPRHNGDGGSEVRRLFGRLLFGWAVRQGRPHPGLHLHTLRRISTDGNGRRRELDRIYPGLSVLEPFARRTTLTVPLSLPPSPSIRTPNGRRHGAYMGPLFAVQLRYKFPIQVFAVAVTLDDCNINAFGNI